MLRNIFAFLFLLSFNNINPQEIKPADNLPFDTTITKGKLDNGLVYYIRHNDKPEKRAFLRLAVNAGSVLEDSSQQGLAHFTEHMAFNGTKNFAKHEIIDYLESIGMRFGPDINAYTSFDETIYMLEVPTDTQGVLEKGLNILKEWAHNVSFENDEIDKERGVVIEEWRLGRGANARIRDKQFPILFKNSVYAERLPIGKKEILESFPYETVKRFYRDWYRPDLMAVIAVGDFDKKEVEEYIKKIFSPIPKAESPRERKIFPVPGNEKMLFAIATDPEATQSTIGIYYKQDVEPEATAGDYRRDIIENLYTGMLNNRMSELAQQPDPPFLYGYSAKGRFIRSKEFYLLSGAVKDEGILRGFKALLTESERVRKYGFTASELQREKNELLANMEKAYKEKDKTESDDLAAEYIRNFLTDEPVPGIEFEYKLYKEFLPGITLQEVNALTGKWITGNNAVVTVSAPEKKDLKIPSDKELADAAEEVKNSEIKPYDDKVSNLPLVEKKPSPASIIAQNNFKDLGITEWQLSNGVKVVLKPTDFKNDEILFQAFSPGGSSVVPDNEYIPASTASTLVRQSGAGNFNFIELQKVLAGKVVDVSTYISELTEGFSGSSTPKDLETMFQLIYLYFTHPRIDSSSYLSYLEKLKSYLKNRSLSPDAAFQDTLDVTMAQYNPRMKPWTMETLDKMDMNESLEIFKDRFADASGFTFFFVGNFEPDSIKPLILTYLGGLPSLKRNESWKDLNIDPPEGVIQKSVYKGLEPKSRVSINFTGPFEWSTENRYKLIAMTDVLRIKLREVLREDKGGTYGVGVSPMGQQYPDQEYKISISFGCAPDRVNELIEAAFQQIDSLKSQPVGSIYLTKVKETQKREWETNLKENSFWLRTLSYYYLNGINIDEISKYPERVDELTAKDITDTAQKYFNEKNYVQVELFPEQKPN
ncbi:MAG TPA: insulinase family protein [Ignavibacteriaceae bacterium]|nr:insulinase family protein [Ignavibacteriaceae bacterium]